ncbi:MAG: hypothetical protein KC680_00075 [Candidatus Peregrinibacteria bacterium]|nr:hypothetical protein [Candidatus Peregrinibacteria bacterium]MCB9808093.1 hypothetical protein [Candidatus Peribacteria bacterium]
MAIVRMQKVAVIAHSSLREDLISMLQSEGVLDVRPAGETQQIDHTEVQYRKAEVEFAITVLTGVADKPTLAICQRPCGVEDIIHAAHHTDVVHIVETLHALEKEDTDAHRRIQELQDFCEQLTLWKNLKTAHMESSENVLQIIGTLPTLQKQKLHDSMTQEIPRSILQEITNNGRESAFLAIIWKDDKETFEEMATALGWSNVQLPTLSQAPREAYEQALMDQKALRQSLEINQKEREKLSIELPSLIKVRTFMYWMDQKQHVREQMGATEETITILGWMPAKEFDMLDHKLHKLSPATMLVKVKPEEGEEAPVALANKKFVTPFESVTTLYGLPLPREMDPTAALSPFFALYFGLCLTDSGYGAVIALIFGIYLFSQKKTIKEAPLWWLLFISGIVTFIVSIPFGGWFGLTPEQAPSFMTHETAEGLRFYGQLWNLNEQSGISFLQNLSLVLGLTHIFFGVFLAGLHKWIHGNKAGAFWQHFTAHILLGTVIVRAFAPEHLASVSTYGIYAALALMVWGLGSGNPLLLRPVMGLLGVVNFGIGLLSNGLSYLRILALGLVTGAIAMAVNQVAVELGKLFPLWIGIPVIVVIALMGHTVSIALNTLGSFIHSGRLQFIEFFSQFFEGGGQAFAPFKRSRL